MASASAQGDEGVVRETRDTPPVHFLFKIESFSLLSENEVDQIKSRNFKVGEHQWKIVLFPKGKDGGKDDHVSIYLLLENTSSLPAGKGIHAFFKFFLFDRIRGKYLTVQGSVRRFDKIKDYWGLAKFISLEDLKEPTNGFLVKDTSVFGVEVFLTEGSCLGECLSISKFTDIFGTHNWEINQFSELRNKCYSDVFTVGGYKWKILLCPRGISAYEDFSLSLFLEYVDSQSSTTEHKVKAKFVLRLKDQLNDQKHMQTEDTIWFGSSRKDWGWKSFIKLKDLKDSKKGYLVDDRCIIEADVSVLCETSQKMLDC